MEIIQICKVIQNWISFEKKTEIFNLVIFHHALLFYLLTWAPWVSKKTPTKGHGRDSFKVCKKWVFPKIGKTPQIIHLFIGFSIMFTIHFGVPVFLETPKYMEPKQDRSRRSARELLDVPLDTAPPKTSCPWSWPLFFQWSVGIRGKLSHFEPVK